MLLNAPEKEDGFLPCLRSWIDGGNENNGTYGIKQLHWAADTRQKEGLFRPN